MALEKGSLFSTLNYQTPDPECPLFVAPAGTPAGQGFVHMSYSPQGQAAPFSFVASKSRHVDRLAKARFDLTVWVGPFIVLDSLKRENTNPTFEPGNRIGAGIRF